MVSTARSFGYYGLRRELTRSGIDLVRLSSQGGRAPLVLPFGGVISPLWGGLPTQKRTLIKQRVATCLPNLASTDCSLHSKRRSLNLHE